MRRGTQGPRAPWQAASLFLLSLLCHIPRFQVFKREGRGLTFLRGLDSAELHAAFGNTSRKLWKLLQRGRLVIQNILPQESALQCSSAAKRTVP